MHDSLVLLIGGPKAKRTLSAAAVIGSRFNLDLLTVLGVEPVVADLVAAYESQLKSDRAQLHRRAAAAIEARDPGSIEENAALIAEHLLREAYEVEHGSDPDNWPHRHPGIVIGAVRRPCGVPGLPVDRPARQLDGGTRLA
jgi:hypothetical protein